MAILRDAAVLAGRRVGPDAVRGGWEFPGGQVEPGETREQAAVREAREELAVDVAVTGVLGEVTIRPGMPMTVFTARLISGEPTATGSHDVLRWLTAAQLDEVPWLPADRPLLGPLAALLGGNADDAGRPERSPASDPADPADPADATDTRRRRRRRSRRRPRASGRPDTGGPPVR